MRPPVFTFLTKLELPPISFWLDTDGSKITLKSEAVYEPEVSLYPELDLGEGRWVYQKGNSLISFADGKTEVLRTSQTQEAVFLRMDNSFYEVVRTKEGYSFQGETFSKLVRYMGRTVLVGKNRATILAQGKVLELEPPLDLYVTKKFISLVYEGEVKVVDEKLNVTYFKRSDYFLGLTSKGKVFKRGNRLYLDDRLIGFCGNFSYLLGEMSDKIAFLCDSSVKVFRNWSWFQVDARASEDRSYVNSSFMILGSSDASLVYNPELNLLFSLKPCSAVADSRRLFLLSHAGHFGVVDSARSREILRVINDKNTINSKIKIAYDKNFSLSFDKQVEVVGEDERGEFKVLQLETSRFENAEVEVILTNPFYSERRVLKLTSDKPKLSFVGEILYSPQGKIKGTESNALLLGTLTYEIPTVLPIVITLRLEQQEVRVEVKEGNKGDVKISEPLSLRNVEDAAVISAFLIRGQNRLFLGDFVVPVKLVSPPDKVVRLVRNRSHVREITLLRENDIFVWKKVLRYPNYSKGLILGLVGEKVVIGGKEIEVKRGIHSYCVSHGMDEMCYDILGIKNPIQRLHVTLDGEYLSVKPISNFTFPIEVFYGLYVYRGFPTKILFPFDPLWDTVKVRSYIGKTTITQEFKLRTLQTAIKRAHTDAIKLGELLSSFGLA